LTPACARAAFTFDGTGNTAYALLDEEGATDMLRLALRAEP